MSSRLSDMHVSPVLAKGALAGCWCFGAFATYHLVVQFDRDLKPMILAMMLAGGLEKPVAWTEMFYVNILRVAQIVFWYPFYLVRRFLYWLAASKKFQKLCFCCSRRFPKDNPYWETGENAQRFDRLVSVADEKLEPEDSHMVVKKMPSWIQQKLPDDLRKPWTDQSAGNRILPRMLALGTVLFTVFLITLEIVEALRLSMSSFYEPGPTSGRANATQDLMNVTAPLIAMLQGNSTSQRHQFYQVQTLSSQLSQMAQNEVEKHREIVTSLLSVGVTTAYQLVMFLLYSFMWLLQPMTSQMQLYKIVNTYFKLKTYCSLVYATITYAVLRWCQVDLGFFIAMLSFFLNFVPEVGAIVSLFLPLPIILFDGEHVPDTADACERYSHSANSTNGTIITGKIFESYQSCMLTSRFSWRMSRIMLVMLLLGSVKLLVGNGLESYLMGSDQVLAGQAEDDQPTAVRTPSSRQRAMTMAKAMTSERHQKKEAEELHPVIILSTVVLGGAVWGPVGMLVSVPLISVSRLAMNQMKETEQASSDASTDDASASDMAAAPRSGQRRNTNKSI